MSSEPSTETPTAVGAIPQQPTHSPAEPAAGAVTPSQTSSLNTDVLAIRFCARLLDNIAVMPLLLLWVIPIIGPLVAAAAIMTYFVLGESRFGGTLGKRLLSLRVESTDGSPLSTGRAVARNSFLLLGFLPYLGYPLSWLALAAIGVGILVSRDRRGPHDRIAKARVVRPAA